jgi:hypothetical protein
MSEPKEWRVHRNWVVVKGVGLVAALALLAFNLGDRRALILCGALGVVLAVLIVRDLVVPVRLAMDDAGITVIRGFAGRQHVPWADVERIVVDVNHRYGRRWEHLEIDTGEQLFVLGSAQLGTSCTEVAAELRAQKGSFGATGGRESGIAQNMADRPEARDTERSVE